MMRHERFKSRRGEDNMLSVRLYIWCSGFKRGRGSRSTSYTRYMWGFGGGIGRAVKGEENLMKNCISRN